jgi:NAD(P)-dependent dehydrogenase (short-subunit alcohol dehydrogenase family)
MEEFRFDGRVAIVTGAGAAAGLGRAHAQLLAARGAKVVVNDVGSGPDGLGIEKAHADRVAQEIRDQGGEAVSDTNSVAGEESARMIVQTALDAYGRVDILVNNAGIVRIAEFEFASSDDIQQIVAIHLMGNIWMCRAVWPLMFEQDYGRIVNVTSRAMWGARYNVVYGAAKGGIFALTRGLAAEGAARNVRVNALAPGARTTAFDYFNDADKTPRLRDRHTPEGVAPAVGYLCHERCELNGAYVAAESGLAVALGVFGTTRGYKCDVDLTIEDMAGNLDVIRDVTGFTQIPEGVDTVGAVLSLKPDVIRTRTNPGRR